RSFTIKVKTGLSLNQLRLIRGPATVSDSALRSLHRTDPLLYHNVSSDKPLVSREIRTSRGLFLHVDLQGEDRGHDRIVGYRAKKNGHGEIRGTQVVLEVRPQDVPFLIHDGQTFFKVIYDKMLEIPTHVYGAALGSSYHRQGLTLSKQLKA